MTDKKPRKQKPTAAAPAVPVAEKPTKPLTDAKRLEMLQGLSPKDQRLMADLVAAFEPIPEREEAAPPTDAPPMPTDTQETPVALEFECVHTLARTVLAQLLTGEFGAQIFDIKNSFSTLECVYLDITDAIEHALPGCDTDELHRAAVEFSVR